MALALAWGIAACAALAAALLLARSSAQAERGRELVAELEAARGELHDVQARLERQKAEHRRRGEELGELRKRLERARRSRGEQREQERADSARVPELEQRLGQREADLERARSELAEAHAQLARLDTRLERERETSRQPLDEALARAAELETALEKAQAERAVFAAALDGERRERARWRKRAENLDKVYMVVRGELELAKDQLRAQQEELERLRALKVALVDAPPPPANN